MKPVETRYPCPVCLGVMLHKVTLTRGDMKLVLDACARCGGIWFELGEVQHLRRHSQKALWAAVERRAGKFRMRCHDCGATIDRNADSCPACGWKNRIACPVCNQPLTPDLHHDIRLDVCRKCFGVWFDHVELESIWRLVLTTPARELRGRRHAAVAGDAGYGIAEVLMYTPDAFFYGAHSAGMAIQGGAELLTHAPEASASLVSGAGEMAAGAFEAIVEAIGEILGGLDF